MKRVVVVCEGQTEETFVRNVLAPAFYGIGLSLIGETVETSIGHKGGGLSYERIRRHIRNTLKQRSQPYVTTFIDLYKLDTHFPGFSASQGLPLTSRLSLLENALADDIQQYTGCESDRFTAYIQPHEFEALLFSDIEQVVGLEMTWAKALPALQIVRNNAETPEHINDKPATKPAAHLQRLLVFPQFRKKFHGELAATSIGLDIIERECPHFADWVSRLRSLADTAD
jgi:hypothetical protein